MKGAAVALALAGCCGKKEAVPPEPAVPSAEAPVPSETQAAMFQRLALRDHAPACADVEALSPTPVADLLWLADHTSLPPWVGMRAAACLVRGHGVEIQDALLRWVSDPATEGLGFLVLDELGSLPDDLALAVAGKAIAEGPDPDAAKARIAKDEREAVRALSGEASGG